MEKKFTDEYEKIVYVVKTLEAKNLESAVTMEQIIEKGISLGLTNDYETTHWEGYKKGDHPWWTKMAVLMGIGTMEQVLAYEEIHLHREQVKKEGVKGKIMVYWFDPQHKHKNVATRKTKAQGSKKVEKNPNVVMDFGDIIHRRSTEENIAKFNANPEKFVLTADGKLLMRSWVEANPAKAMKMYGVSL